MRTFSHAVAVPSTEVQAPEPLTAHVIFNTTMFAVLWSIIRVAIGIVWIWWGWYHLQDPAKVQLGPALQALWSTGTGAHAFQADAGVYLVLDQGIALAEMLVGILLVAGAFVGIAAFAGVVIGWVLAPAGVSLTAFVVLPVTLLLMLAWRVAGWDGLDRFLLKLAKAPAIGTT